MKAPQNGFALIELIILLATAGIIGIAGWHVLHIKHKPVQAAKYSPPKSISQITNFLRIPEWGVGASYTSSLTLKYSMPPNKERIDVTSDQLNQTGGGCTSGSDFSVWRYKAGDIVRVYDGSNNPPKAYETEDLPQYDLPNLSQSGVAYTHIDNYYYALSEYGGYCSNDPKVKMIEDQTYALVKSIVPNLKSL